MVGERQNRRWWVVALVASGACLVAPLVAQSTSVVPDTARLIASSERVRVLGDEGVRLAVLDKTIALSLDDVPLRDALEAIARQAGLKVFYGRDFVSDRRRVSLQAANITVTDALTVALRGTDLDALVSMSGSIVLVRHGQKRLQQRQQGGGTIAGRVTDGVTVAPLNQVAVRVEGSTLGAVTTSDGHYTIRGITPGTYRVTARRVGYTPLVKTVTVAADSVGAVDFALTVAPTRLDEMVTTAVGDQRRVELGNSIATINADSIARNAPVTELTDVLSGRAPGVEVLDQNGQVGAGPRIRIRGLSSFAVSNDPIIYIDGVRLDGTSGSFNGAAPIYFQAGPTPSRLNDLDPADIESIDILKGPSAATEYGTDAANGVIIVKTKRGHAGAPRLDVHAEHGLSVMPTDRFPLAWMDWGHTTDPTHAMVACPRTMGYGGPTVGNGGCVVDSVTTFQPVDHAATTVFGTGPTSRVGAELSGGGAQLQYFISGASDGMTGVLQLPPFFRQQLEHQGQIVPGYELRPNAVTQANARSRVSATLGSTADVSFSAGYIASHQRSVSDGSDLYGAVEGSGYLDPVYGGYGGRGSYSPSNTFSLSSSDDIRRFTGATSGNWRPTSWFSTRATVGIDLGDRTDATFQAPGPGAAFVYFPGNVGAGYNGINHITATLYTVDLGATAAAALVRDVVSKTSVGFQYNVRNDVGTLAQAYGLTANGSLNGAATYASGQIDNETRTVGSYLEESMGWRDRLFVTGAARIDAGSGFGSQVNSAVYPKASVSWAAVQTPGHRLRLRAAYGESGVQPPSGATLSLYTPATVNVGGTSVTGDTAISVGNPQLKPERSTELEAGVDAGLLADRMTLELTYYHKLSQNTIVSNILPGSLGNRIEYENLGEVRNYGVEGTVGVNVVDTRALAWQVTVGGAINQNRLVSLAPGVPPITAPFFPYEVAYQQQPGYPLFGLWAPKLQFADTNHDGIIEPSEVSQSSTLYFQGSPIPTREVTLSTSLSLLNARVRIGAQVDYRGGFTIQNGLQQQIDISGPNGAAFNGPHTSLKEQARAVLSQEVFNPESDAYFQDGSFTRWRELSVTYVVPDRLAHLLRLRSGSVALLGRNLALWTRYGGLDPEVATHNNNGAAGAPLDGVWDVGATPLVRSFALRLNLGL